MRAYPYPTFRTGGPSLAEVLASIPDEDSRVKTLTEGQQRVYRAFRERNTTTGVAEALGISTSTVSSHIAVISRLGLISVVGEVRGKWRNQKVFQSL